MPLRHVAKPTLKQTATIIRSDAEISSTVIESVRSSATRPCLATHHHNHGVGPTVHRALAQHSAYRLACGTKQEHHMCGKQSVLNGAATRHDRTSGGAAGASPEAHHAHLALQSFLSRSVSRQCSHLGGQ
jgi:hypothetical protein